MPMSEPTKKLAQIITRIQQLKSVAASSHLSLSLATTSRTLISEGFEKGKDPDGNPWAPLALRSGQPMRDTGRLGSTAAWEVDARPGSFSLTNRLIQAALLHYGGTVKPVVKKWLRFSARGSDRVFFAKSVTIPSRKMVPSGRLPPEWARRLEATAKRVFTLHLKAA